MDIKTCSKCGWVLDLQDPHNYCPICHTAFEVRVCRICHKPYKMWTKRRVCKHCYQTVIKNNNEDDYRLKRRRIAVYEEWLAKIAKVPKDYPTLTEEQWLEAVQHFDSCALCGRESIDTRGYFVPFQLGGRYCDWNIIPLCTRCATKPRQHYNYFLRERPVGLIKTIDYLEVRLDAAIKKNSSVR